jgi:hypothetical protein
MEKQERYLWLKISRDKYELPEAVADTAAELARMLGVGKSAISKSKHLYIKVRVDGEDEE